MKTIDPYHKWLGIPPKHQPPDHYRLLGLEPFEDDRNVIATAADRQMGFIKTYQTGPPEAEELSQRILNELAAARICLLNRKKKDVYDRGLRAELEKKQANTAVSETERLSGDNLTGQSQASATTAPVEPTSGLPTKYSVPTVPAQVIDIRTRPQRTPRLPSNAMDAAMASPGISEPPLPRQSQVEQTSNDNLEESRIVPIAIGAGIGCILLAGLLIAWVAMRSGRESPENLESPIVAESTAAVDEPHALEELRKEPDPIERQRVKESGESAAIAVPTDHNEQNHIAEPSDESPDAQPIPASDSEASLPEETLEQAEQRLNLEAAGALPASAREQFVQEVLSVTDRAIFDSDAELARRLAELALKVARASNSPELIQRVTLRLIEVRGPITETLKQQAHNRLDQP